MTAQLLDCNRRSKSFKLYFTRRCLHWLYSDTPLDCLTFYCMYLVLSDMSAVVCTLHISLGLVPMYARPRPGWLNKVQDGTARIQQSTRARIRVGQISRRGEKGGSVSCLKSISLFASCKRYQFQLHLKRSGMVQQNNYSLPSVTTLYSDSDR